MTDAPDPKPWIKMIHAYVPGKATGDDGRTMIKLSANENPQGCSPAAEKARADAALPALYPDPDSVALRETIGKLHGIDPGRIVMGTGSGELLTVAACAFAGPGDTVLYTQYGFSLYEIAARRCGATPVATPHADYGTDIDAMLASVDERTRVVFIANPNNPTGSFLTRDQLARLHAGLPSHVLLVVDQAYYEYVEPEDDDGAMDLALAHDNVLVTRTFSKAYGLAGERVGWATGAPALIEVLNRLRAPFNINNGAQAVCLAALEDQAHISRSRTQTALERGRFEEAMLALRNHGIRPLPSEANFILVLFTGPLSAEAAYHGLMERGYIVRWLPGQGLPNGLRITIGMPGEMDEIAEILRDLAEAAQ